MTQRAIWLFALAGLLLIGYLVLFGGLFAGESELRIVSQVMTQRQPRPGQPFPIVFSLGSEQTLLEIRVESDPPADAQVATAPQVVWHVAGQSDEPMRSFVYGRPIPGLEPVAEGADARGDRLTPNLPYRLTLVTDAGQGELRFRTPAARQ